MNLKKTSDAQGRLLFDKKFTQLSITMFVHQVLKYIWDVKGVTFNTGFNMHIIKALHADATSKFSFELDKFYNRTVLSRSGCCRKETKLANSSTR